ncbi:MAG: hypothetical protein IKF83_04835, partial [Clostridia bacterium]|nr:hypothetical protein [Clostridia bacterium]
LNDTHQRCVSFKPVPIDTFPFKPVPIDTTPSPLTTSVPIDCRVMFFCPVPKDSSRRSPVDKQIQIGIK